MNCPRCKTAIPPPPNPDGIVPCPGCGARLMTKAAALRSQGGPKGAPPPPAAGTSPQRYPPSATLPPTPAARLGVDPPTRGERRGEPSGEAALADGGEKPASTPPPAEAASEPEAPPKRPPAAAPPPPEPPAAPPASDEPAVRVTAPSSVVASSPAVGAEEVTLETLYSELVALRAVQEEILALLRRGDGPPADSGAAAEEGPVVSPVRSRRRKSVIVIDDDPATRDAAVAALQQHDVPVRAVADGQAALAAIAAEKPDVIAIEVGLAGDMGGNDVVNMIKATMEWVDIPIVLWTREEIASQREARTIHGADEIVRKSSGPEALVANVITLFRRH
jgi:CheY-like chemotaxis protein